MKYSLIVSTNFERNDTIDFHFHTHHEIIWIRRGVLNLSFSCKLITLTADCTCIIPPLVPHKCEYENADIVTFRFKDDYLYMHYKKEAVNCLPGNFRDTVLTSTNEKLENAAQYLFDSISFFNSSKAYIHLFNIIKSSSMTVDSDTTHKTANKILTYIHENIFNKISLQTISKELNLNKHYVCKLTKKELGFNITEYIAIAKLKHSVDILLNTRYPVSKISEMLSFSSPKYFNKVFKKHFGVTPSEFRNSSQNISRKKYFI